MFAAAAVPPFCPILTVPGRTSETRHGRAHRRTTVLRAHGPQRPAYGVRASQSDGPVVLDLPAGAALDLVPLHGDRRAGLRPLAEGARRPHHAGYRAGLLGGDRR